MISKRELSARRDINTIAGVFDTVKCQRDKLFEMAEWYWFWQDARELQEVGQLCCYARVELWRTIVYALGQFNDLSEEIRKEVGGE